MTVGRSRRPVHIMRILAEVDAKVKAMDTASLPQETANDKSLVKENFTFL